MGMGLGWGAPGAGIDELHKLVAERELAQRREMEEASRLRDDQRQQQALELSRTNALAQQKHSTEVLGEQRRHNQAMEGAAAAETQRKHQETLAKVASLSKAYDEAAAFVQATAPNDQVKQQAMLAINAARAAGNDLPTEFIIKMVGAEKAFKERLAQIEQEEHVRGRVRNQYERPDKPTEGEIEREAVPDEVVSDIAKAYSEQKSYEDVLSILAKNAGIYKTKYPKFRLGSATGTARRLAPAKGFDIGAFLRQPDPNKP